MFTGVVRGCGVVESITKIKRGARLKIRFPREFPPVKIGGSISVDGACLTVVKKEGRFLFFDVVQETMKRTNFSEFIKGTLVNIEPALRWNDRIEGHFVQGHVDGIGVVKEILGQRSNVRLKIDYPSKLGPFLLEKGSVAVNGVSLTLGPVQKNSFWIYLIPHTLNLTNLKQLKMGKKVNLEPDILIKFFRSL